jgi:hypothetical protein
VTATNPPGRSKEVDCKSHPRGNTRTVLLPTPSGLGTYVIVYCTDCDSLLWEAITGILHPEEACFGMGRLTARGESIADPLPVIETNEGYCRIGDVSDCRRDCPGCSCEESGCWVKSEYGGIRCECWAKA